MSLTTEIALQSAKAYAERAASRPRMPAETKAYIARCRWAKAVRESTVAVTRGDNAAESK